MIQQSFFIAIEGIDGVGKGTQARQLQQRLADSGYPTELFAFPRYGEAACANVERYLSGHFGDPDTIDAKQASGYYAEDRLDAAPTIRELLEAGVTVIADRYVDSNAGHQGGKIDDPSEREMYLAWLYELEYEVNAIPKPDLVIVLHAAFDVGQMLLERRTQDLVAAGGEADGHEKNEQHLRRASDAYLWLARREPERYAAINCSPEGVMLSVEDIHGNVWERIEALLDNLEVQ